MERLQYQKDQIYINNENVEYKITGIWWLGLKPTKVEVMRVGGKNEFLYTIKEFETAINESKLILKT